MPFQAVPDLVAQRRVLLRRGFAYVSQRNLASLVVQVFRAKLSMVSARAAAGSLPVVEHTWRCALCPLGASLRCHFLALPVVPREGYTATVLHGMWRPSVALPYGKLPRVKRCMTHAHNTHTRVMLHHAGHTHAHMHTHTHTHTRNTLRERWQRRAQHAK